MKIFQVAVKPVIDTTSEQPAKAIKGDSYIVKAESIAVVASYMAEVLGLDVVTINEIDALKDIVIVE